MRRDYIDNDNLYLLEREFEVKPQEYLETIKRQHVVSTYEERPWYLASPYSKYPAGLEAAYEDACRMTMMLLENDVFTFSPIVNSHGPANRAIDPKNKMDHDFWLTIDFKYVKLSRGLIVCMMDGWKDSFGIGKEIELAKAIKKPIIYTNFMEMPKEFLDDRYTSN